MIVNERQVELRSASSTYTTLKDFFDRRKVIGIPFVDSQEVAVSSAEFILLDSSFIAGTIALGTASVENGGISMATLAGAVGTAATTSIADTFGNLLNLVQIRDDATHDPIVDSNDRVVYGLIQAVSTATDGDAIAAAASENCQMSFVIVAADGTITLTTVNNTIEFQVNKLYLERQMPTLYKDGGTLEREVVDATMIAPLVRKFIVTTAFAADEVITYSTGAGGVAGVSTDTGDTVTTVAAYVTDNRIRIRLNGVQCTKGTDFIRDADTTGHFAIALDIGDTFEIEVSP